MTVVLVFLLIVAVGASIWLGFAWKREERVHADTRARLAVYQPIADLETARQAMEMQIAKRRFEVDAWFAARDVEARSVRSRIEGDERRLEELRRSVAILEEQDWLHEVAFYQVHFDLPNSEAYEARLRHVRDRQQAMLKTGTAAVCATTWTVDGSTAKGKRATEEFNRLLLRAFNGECDALVARVSFKNIQTMEQRLMKAHEALNKLGRPQQCSIVPDYANLKLEELRLAHELQLKLESERAEQREIRARMAEEAREQREREKALRQAEQEASRYAEALEQARRELENSSVSQRAKLEAEIAQLQQRLADAQRRKSMAEQTRSGHVYVLSNVGSFGDGMFKIGMTRRVEPEERVWELSDASVPFDFDIHAMVYTEDAPSLENRLHRHFAALRVNKVNLKREFFRVTLDEIETAIRVMAPEAKVSFTLVAEAEEYRRTTAIEHERQRLAQGAPPALQEPVFA